MEVPLIADGANDGDESALHGLPSKRQSKPCPKTSIRFPVAKNSLAADDDTCYLNLKSAGVHEINSSDDSMSSNCSKINWSESDQLTLQSVEVLCTQCRKQLAGNRSKRAISREESIHGLQPRAERVLSFVNLVCFLGDGKSIYSHFGGVNYVSKADKSDPNHAENGVGRTSIDSQNLAEALKVCQTKLGYGTGFLWIKIHDISDLTDIASAFSLDEFIVASFKNLRAQSDFFLTEKGFLLSICSFQLSENAFRKDDLDPQSGGFSKNQCSMKKLCIYAEDDIVLSYEFDMGFQLDGTVTVTSLHPTDYIVADAEKNREVYRSTGKGYLIGKLIEKSFSLQDSLFESCHDGLSYYSQQVRSLHTDNMKMRGDSLTGFLSHEVVSVRVLQIEYCILLLQAYLLEAVGVISECCEKSRVKNKTWELKIGPSFHRTRGTANCAASSLQQGLLAASHLRKTLNTIVHMRERRMGVSAQPLYPHVS